MIRYGFSMVLLTFFLSATSSLTSISFYVDAKHQATIECVDGIHCTLNSSVGIKNNYNMQRVFESDMGFTKYKDTPKNSIVLELGYWGYAEHRYFKYEPKYKDLFLKKIEYFYDTMNMDGGTTKVRKYQKVRANLDASKVLIFDKKILAELSQFLGKNLKDEVLFDTQQEYDLTEHNIEAYNNLAYYLNKEKVEGVEEMLLFIVKAFPQRAVAYYTLANFYERTMQPYKKKKAYMQYAFYMTLEGKAKKIPKSVKDSLEDLYLVVQNLAKSYDYLTFVKWGEVEAFKSLVLFVESKKGNTKLLVYLYDKKQKKYDLVGTNKKLPPSYAHLPFQNKTGEEEMSDYVFLADIKLDKLLTLKFSQINYSTIFRGVDNQYKFQYHDHKMKLIGAELLNYSRARGDGFADSINYLSGKKESHEVIDVHKQVGKSTWSRLKKSKLMELEEFLYDYVY